MRAASFIAPFTAIFIAIFLPFIFSGKQWREEQEKARARRMAEHRMNARLLRLDISAARHLKAIGALPPTHRNGC